VRRNTRLARFSREFQGRIRWETTSAYQFSPTLALLLMFRRKTDLSSREKYNFFSFTRCDMINILPKPFRMGMQFMEEEEGKRGTACLKLLIYIPTRNSI
jgi:hypothetical protein